MVLPNDGLKAVNIYALADDDGLTLIDGGWALEAAKTALTAGLADIGAGLGDVRRFMVTHAHRDHYTAAIAIRREFGTRVLLGAGERHAIEAKIKPGHPGLGTQFALLSQHGAEPVMAALIALGLGPGALDLGYEAPDEWISSGQIFGVGDRELKAIATPGHTHGHLVFADHDNGLLFAGDHVLPHITPSIGFEVDPPKLALRDYLESLQLVRAMPDMRLLPAHGPSDDMVHARIDALLAHHATRLAEIEAALGTGQVTAYEVSARIPWTSRKRAFAELEPFNQMLAVLETALHLDLLVAQGKAEADGEIVLYRRSGIDTEII